MNRYFHYFKRKYKRCQKGGVIPLVAICLTLFIALAALGIDLGYFFVGRNELQNAADAGALAGARVLGKIYQGDDTLSPAVDSMSYSKQQTYNCSDQLTFPTGTYGITGATNDCEFIINQVKRAADENSAGGSNVTIRTEDIFIGTWDGTSLTETNSQPDAVRVRARRDNFTMPLTTFFAKAFQVDTMSVSALATAALTGMSTAGPGELELPIGIPDTVFDRPPAEWCQSDIKFSPPTLTDVCGGFTDYQNDNSVTPGGLNNLIDGTTESPAITANVSFVGWNNGSSNVQTYDKLLTAFQQKGYDVDANGNPRLRPDGTAAGPSEVLSGIGPPVPLTELSPLFDDTPVAVDSSTNPQLNYPPCSGGSGNCSGPPRYRHIWETGIVVYDHVPMTDPCIPNKIAKIVGFAEIRMKDVFTAPDKYIQGTLLCNYVSEEDNRGGGGTFGKKGPIPGLVE